MAQRNYPDWLSAYMEYTKDTEAPPHFHMWVGLWALASVVKRNVWIPQRVFDWVPNQYIILVGAPGVVTKSTSIRIAEKLLRATQRVRFGSNSSTWQTLVMELAAAQEGNVETGRVSSPLSLVVSELGSFLDMENREQIDFMVDIWDAQEGLWKRNTIGSGEKKIESACLNFIAATTPNWIKQNFKQSMVGGGFSSRLIMVLGEKKRRAIAYPGYEGIGLRDEMHDKLVEDLIAISEIEGEISLSAEAIEWGTEWYVNHLEHPKLRRLQGDQFEGYYARKQTHMHKIAMLLSVSRNDSRIIDARHLKAAHGMLLEMERDYGKIMEFAQAGGYYSQAKVEVLRRIREGVSDKDSLYAEMSTVISGNDFERIMGDLAKARLISQKVIPGSGKITIVANTAEVLSMKKS